MLLISNDVIAATTEKVHSCDIRSASHDMRKCILYAIYLFPELLTDEIGKAQYGTNSTQIALVTLNVVSLWHIYCRNLFVLTRQTIDFCCPYFKPVFVDMSTQSVHNVFI